MYLMMYLKKSTQETSSLEIKGDIMKKNIIFDPSYGTLNMGDVIIVESTLNQMKDIIGEDFNIRLSSHQPSLHFHQVFLKNIYKEPFKTAKNKFILGSNLLFKEFIFSRKRPWNIHFLTSRYINDVILVGVGSNKNNRRPNLYTKSLYKKVLSSKYIHSVRDEDTLNYVEQVLGLEAINTGCATMWSLTPEHCSKIKRKKSKDVVFTLTDYARDMELDKFLINKLIELYEDVYFWPQGSEDYSYLRELDVDFSRIKPLDNSLESYKEVLSLGDIDYVGSRLHGGIYALQHKIRTVIIAVDHRALNKKRDYNLPVIKREDSRKDLEKLINSEFETIISIDLEKIERWKNQFGGK